jgi:cation:H+ antiporter
LPEKVVPEAMMPKRGSSMSTTLSILSVIGGFGIMTLGSYMLVNGASNLARAFGVTEMVIGVTIVALGTSLPEFITVLISSATNKHSIGFGNIVGSNIINVLGILGLAIIIAPIKIERLDVTPATWIAFITASLYIVYCLAVRNRLGRVDGVILFTGFVLFTVYNYVQGKAGS